MNASSFLILVLALALAGAGCTHTHSGERTHTEPAIIRVERPENNGSVNSLPCAILFSDGQTCTLIGGDDAIVSVRPGTLWVAASSPDPYRPDSVDPAAWRSPRFYFHADPGRTLRFSVEPKSEGSAYFGGWTIERVGAK